MRPQYGPAVPRVRSVVAFGDEVGLPRLLRLLPPGLVRAVVRAEVRPAAAPLLEALAEERGVPLLVQLPPADPRSTGLVRALRELSPDLLLVDSYSLRLGPELLDAAALGGLNVHGALLPRHRGANPTQWALIDDDRETGVTVHRMTQSLDEGDILAQARVPIRFTDTWVDVNRRISRSTEALLARELPRILAGDLRGVPQDEAQASYRPRRRPEDGRIDWTARSLDVYNLIRALVAPHPGAFYERGARRVVIDRFVPIGEVAAMKFGPEGRRPSPLGAPRVEGDDLVLGRARLVDIDWEARTARLVGASEAARAFALSELGLDVASD